MRATTRDRSGQRRAGRAAVRGLLTLCALATCAAAAAATPAPAMSFAAGERAGGLTAIGAGDDRPNVRIAPGGEGELLLFARNQSGPGIEAHDILLLTRIDGRLPFAGSEPVGGGRVFVSTSVGFDAIGTPPPFDLGPAIGSSGLPTDIDVAGNSHWQALDLDPPAAPQAVTWVAHYVPRLVSPFSTGGPTQVVATVRLTHPATACEDESVTVAARLLVSAAALEGELETALPEALSLTDQEPLHLEGGIGARRVRLDTTLPDPILLGGAPGSVPLHYTVHNEGEVELAGNRLRLRLDPVASEGGSLRPALLSVDAGDGATVDLDALGQGVIDVHFASLMPASQRTVAVTLEFPACTAPARPRFVSEFQGNDALCGRTLQAAAEPSVDLRRDPALVGALDAPVDALVALGDDRLLATAPFILSAPSGAGLDQPSLRIEDFGVATADDFVLPELLGVDAAAEADVLIEESGFSRTVTVGWPDLEPLGQRQAGLALRMPLGVIAHPDYPFSLRGEARVGPCPDDRAIRNASIVLEGVPGLEPGLSAVTSAVEPGSELEFRLTALNQGPVAAGLATLFVPIPDGSVLLDVRHPAGFEAEFLSTLIYCAAPPDDAQLPRTLDSPTPDWPVDLQAEYGGSAEDYLAGFGFVLADIDFEGQRFTCPQGEATRWIAALLTASTDAFLAAGSAGARHLALRLRNDEVPDQPNLVDQPSPEGSLITARAGLQSLESGLELGPSAAVQLGSASPLALACPPARSVRGDPVRVGLQADGGKPPYRYALADGSLPPGILLDGDRLQGIATALGTFAFSLEVSDSAERTALAMCSIEVRAASLFADGFELPRP